MGAPKTKFEVKTPAAVACVSEKISARSFFLSDFIPQCIPEAFIPLTRVRFPCSIIFTEKP
jgi:hypothetical protein